MRTSLIALSGIFLSCCHGQDERVVDRWDDNSVKTVKFYYNERDTSQYLLVKYSKNGEQSERTHYEGKIRNGWSIASHENGRIKDSTFYRNNIPVETTQHFYRNGNLSYTGQFDDNGKKSGRWLYYDSQGHLSEIIEFAGANVKIKTTCFDTLGWMIKESFYEPGSIDVISEEKNYTDSLLNGQFKRYHPNGVIAQKGEFIRSKKINTTWQEFYATGQILKEYIYTGEYEGSIKIINIWEEAGIQTVKNGNGKHITYKYCQDGSKKTKIITKYKSGRPIETKEYPIRSCR